MCLDKGYDFPEVYELLEEYVWILYGYHTTHIPLRGEERRGEKRRRSSEVTPGSRARHWVVERTHYPMNRCKHLLIGWEKKMENHIAMLHYACAWITYKRGGVFSDRLLLNDLLLISDLDIILQQETVQVPLKLSV
jgi:hypothetical protein